MSNCTLKLSIVCRGCGKLHELMVDPQDKRDHENKVGQKRFAQHAYPYLNADDRELIISQTCGKCWADMFPPEEDETP